MPPTATAPASAPESAAKPIFRARRLGHVNFFVDDLKRSTEFYNSTCGLALEFVEAGLKASFLGTGNTPHDVGCIETTKGKDRFGRDGHLQLPKDVGVRPGLNHLAWEIDNEAELIESYDRCLAAGLAIGRLADHQIAHSIYMRDPDGNVAEFYVDTIRDWRSVLHGELDLITSVWDPKSKPPNGEPLYDPAPELRVVDDATFHPRRLARGVLATRQPDRLLEFYTGVAGLSRTGGRNGVHELSGTEGCNGPHLVIVAAAGGIEPGLHHFSLELDDEAALDAAADALVARGTSVDRRIAIASKRSIFLRDPDGQRVEMFCKARGAQASEAQRPLDPYLI
jgi:catechol 2,3-dioxygenase